VLSHSRTIQGTYSSILSEGRKGFQWWMLEAWPDEQPGPVDLHQHAKHLAKEFSSELRRMIDLTKGENLQRWPIRDRQPLPRWSKGRITLAGDAAHATSPYAAYGEFEATFTVCVKRLFANRCPSLFRCGHVHLRWLLLGTMFGRRGSERHRSCGECPAQLRV
jgi:hypothetical protein